ncbi:MAG: NAD(P)/FAD-dependent oxidoreductase [Alphaproteobacteria bacterium]|nr:NAD(P)/FAD-dependent oxidoreductase [Alphaproteobacteria bacterium]
MNQAYDVVIVGAGFTGLAAGMALARAGKSVAILEADARPGGLASSFQFADGVTIEKFYHHWFNSDGYLPKIIGQLGLEAQVLTGPSKTGMYYNSRLWNLSNPLDLLRFTPLSLIDRIRLGLLVFQVRRVRDWKAIEHLSIEEWLKPLCGPKVFQVIWRPLLEHKFSVFADMIGAVWMWKKLVLRGGTRDSKGGEQLAYFRGGFGRLAQAMADDITRNGGVIRYGAKVTRAEVEDGMVTALACGEESIAARQFLFTPAFPIIADWFAPSDWVRSLRRVNYLGNACLVLELDRGLSDTYWLNVNDPGFPFVGIIEHTNFDDPDNYQGNHIVFLSRYMARQDPVWSYDDERYLLFALEHIKRMFPAFERSWIKDYRLWRAEYAQPVVERAYSAYVPAHETPYPNAFIATMAQIYPEDRGTNYAIRDGLRAAADMLRPDRMLSA